MSTRALAAIRCPFSNPGASFLRNVPKAIVPQRPALTGQACVRWLRLKRCVVFAIQPSEMGPTHMKNGVCNCICRILLAYIFFYVFTAQAFEKCLHRLFLTHMRRTGKRYHTSARLLSPKPPTNERAFIHCNIMLDLYNSKNASVSPWFGTEKARWAKRTW